MCCECASLWLHLVLHRCSSQKLSRLPCPLLCLSILRDVLTLLSQLKLPMRRKANIRPCGKIPEGSHVPWRQVLFNEPLSVLQGTGSNPLKCFLSAWVPLPLNFEPHLAVLRPYFWPCLQELVLMLLGGPYGVLEMEPGSATRKAKHSTHCYYHSSP